MRIAPHVPNPTMRTSEVQKSPGNSLPSARPRRFCDELGGGRSQPEVEEPEIADDHRREGESPITIHANAVYQDGEGHDADGERQDLADEVDNRVARKQAPTREITGGAQNAARTRRPAARSKVSKGERPKQYP